MDILFEQQVIQNTALAAETIWQAVNEAFNASKRTAGVSLPIAFLVLPLTFHRRSATVLAARTQSGALYKALAEDREITVGLQSRMQAMADRTFAALSLGFDSELLKLDSNASRDILPGRKTPPVGHVTDEVKTIMSAAKRVGHSLTEMTPAQLAVQLNIRF